MTIFRTLLAVLAMVLLGSSAIAQGVLNKYKDLQRRYNEVPLYGVKTPNPHIFGEIEIQWMHDHHSEFSPHLPYYYRSDLHYLDNENRSFCSEFEESLGLSEFSIPELDDHNFREIIVRRIHRLGGQGKVNKRSPVAGFHKKIMFPRKATKLGLISTGLTALFKDTADEYETTLLFEGDEIRCMEKWPIFNKTPWVPITETLSSIFRGTEWVQ